MATTFTPPIDLYAESREGFGEEHDTPYEQHPPDARPADNGERDEPAIAAGSHRLNQVLGW
ncbi:MAG: hypothetical protein M3389_10830 [Actinomycetota bacterium]|nr:hypothetical protein [Actinomycetota bacterium]